jgi:hypothetical protein
VIRRLGGSIVAGAWLALLVVVTALAAEPTPSAVGGDPRSSGEGPGLVGEPLLALGAVLAIALLAVVVTTAWVRLTGGRR